MLPFKRLDTADDSERLGMGMADTLITRLSNIRELSIRPTRDVMRYEDAQGDIADAAKALDVDAILDGSIQRGGDRLARDSAIDSHGNQIADMGRSVR